MPYYPGACEPEALLAALTLCSADDGRWKVQFGALCSSGTAKTFNRLWAAALTKAQRGKITHFAMLHSDIAPEPGFLDVLMEECCRLNADLVSAVIPLKDGRAVTSTAIDV